MNNWRCTLIQLSPPSDNIIFYTTFFLHIHNYINFYISYEKASQLLQTKSVSKLKKNLILTITVTQNIDAS